MRGRPREFDRDEVLDRAVEVFWERGYEATPIAELVEELGIGRQSLYLAFGDKRSLFEEALARYAETRVGGMIETLRGSGSPLGNVKRVLRTWQEAAGSRECIGCLIGNSAAEFGSRDAELAGTLERHFRRLEDAFADALRRAREAGELSPDKEPRALARMLVNTSQGLALTGSVKRSRAYARDVIRTALSLLD